MIGSERQGPQAGRDEQDPRSPESARLKEDTLRPEPPPCEPRVLGISEAVERCSGWREEGEVVVLTNGCFDLLHAGHVTYLNAARACGDRLVIALNDDLSVRRLKGADRPLNPLADRATVLAALRSVDLVVPFSGPEAVPVVEALRPDVYVKGGDYDDEQRQPPEAEVARRLGAIVRYLSFVDGRSTSELLTQIRAQKPSAGEPSRGSS